MVQPALFCTFLAGCNVAVAGVWDLLGMLYENHSKFDIKSIRAMMRS